MYLGHMGNVEKTSRFLDQRIKVGNQLYFQKEKAPLRNLRGGINNTRSNSAIFQTKVVHKKNSTEIETTVKSVKSLRRKFRIPQS